MTFTLADKYAKQILCEYIRIPNHGLLSGTFATVKTRRPRLVLGWVNIRENRAM